MSAADSPTAPIAADALEQALAELARGAPYKRALELLLLDLEPAQADALMLLLKESRGAWAVLAAGQASEALLVGNALSGSAVALGAAGYRVTLLDPSPPRARLALHRASAYGQPDTQAIAGAGPRLPFTDESFGLVVHEAFAPGVSAARHVPVSELLRVARDEAVLVTDNRLAYKRSSGLRGKFVVPHPLAWIAHALRPPAGERSLRGQRRVFARAGSSETRAFALYPHANDFSHVVGLDGSGPELTIGPRERRNLLKMAARRLGLFPWLAPSFAVLGRKPAAVLGRKPAAVLGRKPAAVLGRKPAAVPGRKPAAVPGREPAGSGTTRTHLTRALAALARELDEPTPEVDILVATRSNSAVVHTHVAGQGEDQARGRWTLHVPLNPRKRQLVTDHIELMGRVARDFPRVPVPEPLFVGELAGLWLSAERRLPGLSAPHLTGDEPAGARLLADVAGHLGALRLDAPRPIDDERFARCVAARFAIVRAHAGRAATQRALDAMLGGVRERLIGRRAPEVLYHGDLRAKHIQVRGSGEVLGYLDWGAGEERFLPYVDLLHLLVHQRKQQHGTSAQEAWEGIVRGELTGAEERALEVYTRAVGLDPEVRAAVELGFPAFVAGMAELHWDFSRPRWVHREFGI